MAELDLESTFFLCDGVWALLWAGLCFASRRHPRLRLPGYVTFAAIGLPALGGAAVAGCGIAGMETYSNARYATVEVLGGLWPLIMGGLTSMFMESMHLWVRGPQDIKTPRQAVGLAIRQLTLPSKPSFYILLAAVAVGWTAWLEWPETILRAASSQILAAASLSVFAVMAGVLPIVLRRLPNSRLRRQIERHMRKILLLLIILTGLAWLDYLAERFDWDMLFHLVLIGINLLVFVGLQIALIVFIIRHHQARRTSQDPKCSKCGYILYHASAGRCPECGQPFDIDDLDLSRATIDEQGVIRPR